MNRHDVLERELVWDEAGHLSEIAKSALADGQDAILPPEALAHFSRCQPCVQSVGEAALLSAQMSAALAAERVPERSSPWIPIAAALAIAALSAIPMLSSVRVWLALTGSFVGHVLRLLGRAVVDVAAHGFAPTLYFASTSVLLAMGFAVARLMPRMSARTVQGKGFSS
jgi:hypothetical protein